MDEAALTGILIDYHQAENSILYGDFDGAIMLLDFVWNRIKPYARVDFERPSEQVKKAISEESHDESELLGNPFFAYTSHRQRMRYIQQEQDTIKYHKLQEVLKQIIDQIDKFKMYLPSYGKGGREEPVMTTSE